MAIRKEERQRLRRELIIRTARVWSRLTKELKNKLNEVADSWIKELCDKEFPEKFTKILKSGLREALAYGYWLQWLYLYELRGKKYRGKITLAEGDSVKDSVQDFMTNGEWNEIIPKNAVDWINGYVPKLSGNFSSDILEKTRDVIKNSLQEGTTLQEREKELQKVLDVSKSRIESIARTEITRAHNLGSLTAMKANEDVIGVEFSAVLDNRTTIMCQERHGLRMRLDDPRIPENTPPLHVRCRSMLLALTIYDYPDGLLTSHEFDDGISPGEQRPEDIEEVQKIVENDNAKKSAGENSKENESAEVKTPKNAEKRALDLGITKNVDFRGLDVKAANELIDGISRAREIFPDLPAFDFIGSCQSHYNFVFDIKIKEEFQNNIKYWRSKYKGKTDEQIIDIMKNLKLNNIKKEKVAFETLALSFSKKDAKGISLNKNRFSSKTITETIQDIVFDEKEKYSPVGCNTIKSVVDHEMGHQIDNLILARKDIKIIELYNKYHTKGLMKDVLSAYADEDNDIEEFIAEAWAEYQNNPKPREVANTVAERMIEIYKESKSK